MPGVPGGSCSIKATQTYPKDPRTKNPGVFVYTKEKMQEIDYKNLNERIVEQAYASAQVLNEEQKRKLIQDKFERARAYRKAQETCPLWHTDR